MNEILKDKSLYVGLLGQMSGIGNFPRDPCSIFLMTETVDKRARVFVQIKKQDIMQLFHE